MNKILRYGGIVFVFIAMSVQAADLELVELMFEGTPCRKDGNDFFKDATKIAIKVKSFDFSVNPYRAKLTITLQGDDYIERDLEGDLEEMAPSAISNLSIAYRPHLSASDFLKRIMAHPYKVAQKFKWHDDNFYDLDGLGSPELIFINKNAVHEAKFCSTCYFDCNKDEHITHMQVGYGFDGKEPMYSHDVYALHHAAEAALLPSIKYIDEQSCIKDVQIIRYNSVPKEYEDWAKTNKVSAQEYAELQESNRDPIVFALDVAPHALNKYYRQETLHEASDFKFMWSDGTGNFFITKKIESNYYEQNDPQKVGMDVKFCDSDGPTSKFKCYTLEKSDEPIDFPQSFSVQGKFKTGYYRLNNTTNTLGGIVQNWIEEPLSAGSVDITINGIKINDKFSPLPGFATVVPRLRKGKLVFDLSTILHDMTNNQFDDFKDYLIAAHWLEQKTPTIKYKFASRTIAESKRANARINQLINDIGVIELDLDKGIILESIGESCLLISSDRGPYTSKRGHSALSISTGDMRDFFKKNTALIKIRFSPGSFANLSQKAIDLLAQHEQIKYVELSEFSHDNKGKVRHGKLFPKFIGLQKLKMPNVQISDYDFFRLLMQNAPTLVHLDFSGINNLHAYGDHFVEAVKYMPHLQYINVLNSGLSNLQTVALAKALEDKKNLVEIALEMPYWIHSGIELSVRTYQEVSNAAHPALVFGGVIFCLLAIPNVLFEGTFQDIAGFNGFDFDDTILSLARIAKLKELKLKIKKNQNISRERFNRIRYNLTLLGPINIELVE